VIIKSIILVLALCVSSVANAQQSVAAADHWLSQAELVVTFEESRCDLAFDTMPKEFFLAQGGSVVRAPKARPVVMLASTVTIPADNPEAVLVMVNYKVK